MAATANAFVTTTVSGKTIKEGSMDSGASSKTLLHRFIAAVPKAELHVHIEGTLQPEMMLEFAKRNGLAAPYPSVEAAKAAYDFHDLQSFLDLYYFGCSVLRTHRDFYDLAWAYLTKASEENITHTEIFFDPQTHLANNVPFETFFSGLNDACKDARAKLGVDAHLIMCFLRHLSEEDAMETLEKALPFKSGIIGIGLDSSEKDHPPLKFNTVMARARQEGFPIVAHAGEEGPAANIWDCLNHLHVSRIDHGVHAIDSPELMKHLAETKVPLTVCPLSNLKLKVFAGELPQRLAELIVGTGLAITINSDDPAYFGGYLNENFEWLADALNLNITQVAELAKNSFTGSFVSAELKAKWVGQVDAVLAQFTTQQ